MSVAIDRIEASRQRLLAAMTPPPAPVASPGVSHDHNVLHTFAERVKAMPTMAAIIESVESWWARHPLRPLGTVAGEASRAVAAPIAARHPFYLVLGAAVAGAALVRVRPWRWLFGSALFAGLLPQLATRVVASLPLESWLSVAGSTLSRGGNRRSVHTGTPAETAARP